MDRNLPGSSVHGIFQARILEWVAVSFSMPTKEVVFSAYLSMHLNITEISLPFFFGREVYTHYTTLHSDTQTLIHSQPLRLEEVTVPYSDINEARPLDRGICDQREQ